MRSIHIFTHEFVPRKGGAATVCEELAAAAHSLGHSVTVWAPRLPDETRERARRERFPFSVKPLPVRGKRDPVDCASFARFFFRHVAGTLPPDTVVHLAEAGPVTACAMFPNWPLLQRLRPVVTLHGSELLRLSQSILLRRRFARLLACSGAIHTLSRDNASRVRAFNPALEAAVRRLPGAPRQIAPHDLNAEPVLDPRTINIISTARVHPRKGQHVLIEALRLLPEELKSGSSAWIVGPIIDHAYYKDCYRLALHSGVAVHFIHGAGNHWVAQAYGKSDIFCLPSLPYRKSIEGFGLVNLEAAAHGLPVVSSETGGTRDTLLPGETGYLVPPGDANALSRVLAELIRSSETRERMGAAGRAFASTFSWTDTARGLYGA